MKNRIILGAVAALLCFSSAASAQDVFVRNHPFKQVVGSSSEPYVPAEAFLRALGYNWSVAGQNVVLTTDPAANSPIPSGNVNFIHGENTLNLETTVRGNSTYVSMLPVARFLRYTVNRSGGIIDISKGRDVTESDRKIAAQIDKDKMDQEKAIDEAWAKKAAEIKEKREAAAAADSKDDKDKDKDKDKTTDTKTTTTTTTKVATAPSANNTTTTTTTKVEDKKTTEPKPAARLEVFRADARPDYSTGDIQMEVEVRNQGNGPADSVSGTVVLYGPGPDNVGEVEYYRTSVHGPSLKPDGSWVYKGDWRHRDGASMPHGNVRVEMKLN